MIRIDHARDCVFGAKLLVLFVVDTKLPDASLGSVGELTAFSHELDPPVIQNGEFITDRTDIRDDMR